MLRATNTDEECIDLTRKYNSHPYRYHSKPSGLWYGIDNEWLEWVKIEMPHWECKNNLEFDVDEQHLLIIQNHEDLALFIDKYHEKEEEEDRFGTINWASVAEEWKGIEFRNYWEIKCKTQIGYDPRYLWFWGLDCSGGCIWDLSCILIKDISYI